MPSGVSSESCENIDTYRVVVIGGGPAGCAAARALARIGQPIALLDRAGPNRDKACGDMFMPEAIAIIERLGLSCQNLNSIGTSFKVVNLLGAQGLLRKKIYSTKPAWIFRRRLIDQALRDSLPPNVAVLYNTSVAEVRKSNACLRVHARAATGREIHFRCAAVVLAAGAQNGLAAQWGIAGFPIIAPALSAYVRNPDFKTPSFEFTNTCHPGYRWVFPTDYGETNVGVCSLMGVTGAQLKQRGTELLAAYRIADDVHWRGGVGTLWSGRGKRWHHDAGVVACGDAAGLADPITGEGLTAALTSGWAAGNAVANFLNYKRDSSWLEGYTNRVKAAFDAVYAPSPKRSAWKQLCGLTLP